MAVSLASHRVRTRELPAWGTGRPGRPSTGKPQPEGGQEAQALVEEAAQQEPPPGHAPP